jgi:hypothetical protein
MLNCTQCTLYNIYLYIQYILYYMQNTIQYIMGSPFRIQTFKLAQHGVNLQLLNKSIYINAFSASRLSDCPPFALSPAAAHSLHFVYNPSDLLKAMQTFNF